MLGWVKLGFVRISLVVLDRLGLDKVMWQVGYS